MKKARFIFFIFLLVTTLSASLCYSQQFNQYDIDQNWEIGDFELLDAIDSWAVGGLGDFDLLDLIDYWAAGCYQWNILDNRYEAGCASSAPTSSDLIDQAVKDGQIDSETAIIYKAYAMFHDPRLPVEYVEDDPGIVDPDFLWNALFNFDTLLDVTREALAPFLIPPMYSGSWWDIQQSQQNAATVQALAGVPCNPLRERCPLVFGWTYLPGTNINVWYQDRYASTDAALAAIIMNVIEGQAWPRLTSYMGTSPKPDNGPIVAFEGPDTKLDIALVDMGPYGTTFPSFALKNCGNTSTYILINRTADVGPTSIHEFMHSIQFALPVKECLTINYKTLMESTANWAVHYIDSTTTPPWEHQYADDYMNDITKSLLNKEPALRPYGAYLFPLYLTNKEDANLVKQAWSLAASNSQSNVFKNLVDLDTVWPEFAARLWMEPPFEELKNWGSITKKVVTGNDHFQLKLNGNTEDDMVVTPGDLFGLSAYIVRAEFKDNMIRTATFFNGFTYKLSYNTTPSFGDNVVASALTPEERSGAHVHAIVKINGVWETTLRDWTDVPYVQFHRDIEGKTIDEVLIIFTNSSSDVNHKVMYKGLPSHFWMSNIPTAIPWEGSVFFEEIDDGVTETFTVSNITFEPSQAVTSAVSEITALTEPLAVAYKLTSGSATWSISGTDSSGCVSFSGPPITRSLTTGFFPNQLMFYYFIRSGASLHGYGLSGFDNNPPIQWPYTKTCPDSSPDDMVSIGNFFLGVQTANSGSKVSNDGLSISGTGSDTGKSTVTGLWNITATP